MQSAKQDGPKEAILEHIIIKMEKVKDTERILKAVIDVRAMIKVKLLTSGYFRGKLVLSV